MRGGVRSGRDPREAWELRRQPMDRCGLGWVAHEQAGDGGVMEEEAAARVHGSECLERWFRGGELIACLVLRWKTGDRLPRDAPNGWALSSLSICAIC